MHAASNAHGIETADYDRTERYGRWHNGQYTESDIRACADLKFVGRTWLDVFDEFLLPGIADQIPFNTVVEQVNYTGAEITLSTKSGGTYRADKVIITVPIVPLREHITFAPPLPRSMGSALDQAHDKAHPWLVLGRHWCRTLPACARVLGLDPRGNTAGWHDAETRPPTCAIL